MLSLKTILPTLIYEPQLAQLKVRKPNFTTWNLAFLLQNILNLNYFFWCVYLCFPYCKLEHKCALLQYYIEVWKCLKSRRPDAETLLNNQSFLTFKTPVIGPASSRILQLPGKMTFTLLCQYVSIINTEHFISLHLLLSFSSPTFSHFLLISDRRELKWKRFSVTYLICNTEPFCCIQRKYFMSLFTFSEMILNFDTWCCYNKIKMCLSIICKL